MSLIALLHGAAEVGKGDMHHRGMIAAGRRFRIVWFLNGACFIHTLLIQLESSVCLQPGRIAAAKFTVCILHAVNVICKINASMTTSTEFQKKKDLVAWFCMS